MRLGAAESNNKVHFIFLSSISVYGENRKKNADVNENSPCFPTTAYAQSKLNAEKSLKEFYENGLLMKLDVFRLAPVYDYNWTLNLDKRVLWPKKLFYLKFGSGEQKMSVLSRDNLCDFIRFRMIENNSNRFCDVFNVTDKYPCSFNQIIKIFKHSKVQTGKLSIKIPLSLVWITTRFAGAIFNNKTKWFYSCYDKVTFDLVFNNTKMIDTGFDPIYNIESVFKRKLEQL